MKNFVSLGCAIVLFVGTVSAADEKIGFRLVRGQVQDLNETTMKVKDNQATNAYQATDGLRVNVEGKNKLGDFKNGEEITIVYSRQGDKNLIREINSNQIISGKLQRSDANQMTIKDSNDKVWSIRLNDQTRFSRDDKPGDGPNILREGDTCTIAYTKSGDTHTARFVQANSR